MRYDRGVIESFVDLTYRGLSLGRRVRLSQVRPSYGWLELPAPMPVGTQIAIAADEGVAFEATVTWSYEQVAGASRPPGMTVTPALTAGPAAAWWAARVALPDDDVAGQAPVAAGGRSRPVMEAPALEAPAGEASMMRRTGEHDVVDDGSRTMIMESLDPATLDVEPGAADDAGGPDASEAPDPGDGAPSGDAAPPSGGGHKKRKLRR